MCVCVCVSMGILRWGIPSIVFFSGTYSAAREVLSFKEWEPQCDGIGKNAGLRVRRCGLDSRSLRLPFW